MIKFKPTILFLFVPTVLFSFCFKFSCPLLDYFLVFHFICCVGLLGIFVLFCLNGCSIEYNMHFKIFIEVKFT